MVRKNEREPSRFETADIALKMSAHTYSVVSNPKIFSPIYAKLTNRISYEASMIYHKVRIANEIRVKSPEEAKKRLDLQDEALGLCEDLITDILIAKRVFKLRMKKTVYWNSLVLETKQKIISWHKSDIIRFRESGITRDDGC